VIFVFAGVLLASSWSILTRREQGRNAVVRLARKVVPLVVSARLCSQ